MKNSIGITIPDFIIQAFPLLNEATYVREFASFITLYPDAVYYLFQTTAGQSLILVAIDYPDPTDESQQVKKISGGFEFEFIYLSSQTQMVVFTIIWQQSNKSGVGRFMLAEHF